LVAHLVEIANTAQLRRVVFADIEVFENDNLIAMYVRYLVDFLRIQAPVPEVVLGSGNEES